MILNFEYGKKETFFHIVSCTETNFYTYTTTPSPAFHFPQILKLILFLILQSNIWYKMN